MVNNLFAIEKTYGFSVENKSQLTSKFFNKTKKEDKKGGFSYFVEEEDLGENEDEIGLDFHFFYHPNHTFIFLNNIKKVQFSIRKNSTYFSFYHIPLFIFFRNIRL